MTLRQLTGTAALVALSLLPMTSAEAGSSRREAATVTACSTHGHFTCETARRIAPSTLVLRGGTKLDYAWDCREALRKETVDFWDTQRETGG